MNDYGRLEQSALQRDIDSVVRSNNKRPQWVYLTAIIHTVDSG